MALKTIELLLARPCLWDSKLSSSISADLAIKILRDMVKMAIWDREWWVHNKCTISTTKIHITSKESHRTTWTISRCPCSHCLQPKSTLTKSALPLFKTTTLSHQLLTIPRQAAHRIAMKKDTQGGLNFLMTPKIMVSSSWTQMKAIFLSTTMTCKKQG